MNILSENEIKVLVEMMSKVTNEEIKDKMELIEIVKSTLNIDAVTAVELIKDWTNKENEVGKSVSNGYVELMQLVTNESTYEDIHSAIISLRNLIPNRSFLIEDGEINELKRIENIILNKIENEITNKNLKYVEHWSYLHKKLKDLNNLL